MRLSKEQLICESYLNRMSQDPLPLTILEYGLATLGVFKNKKYLYLDKILREDEEAQG